MLQVAWWVLGIYHQIHATVQTEQCVTCTWPTDVATAALGTSQLTVEVVSTKCFCCDLQHSGVVSTAWVGLLREAEAHVPSA